MNVRAMTLSIVLSGVWAGPSFAEDRGSQSDQDACTPDVFRLCQEFIPNEDPIVACLKSKRDQLSPACHHVFFSDPPPPAQPPADDKTDAAPNAGSNTNAGPEGADAGDPPPVHHKHHKMHNQADGQPAPRPHHHRHPRHHTSDQN